VGVSVPAHPGQIFMLDSVLRAGRSLVLSLSLHSFLHPGRVFCSPGFISLLPAEAAAKRFSVRLSVPGSRPVDWACCGLLPNLFQSILFAAKPICSLLISFCTSKRSLCFALWSAVPDFGLICFPSVVVPALSVAVA
jgi:hypothetical protein